MSVTGLNSHYRNWLETNQPNKCKENKDKNKFPPENKNKPPPKIGNKSISPLKTKNKIGKKSKYNPSKSLKNKNKFQQKSEIPQQKRNDTITIHHVNSRGTTGKLEEIFQYIEDNCPDILLVTESRLDESVSDRFCEPPGFRIIRKDRSEKFKRKYNMTGLGGRNSNFAQERTFNRNF